MLDSISSRIMQVVDALGGNKSDFARRINVTPAYISKLSKQPDSVPSDRTIADICREFNVSEHWLRTGEGDMFLPVDPDQELQDIFAQITLSGASDSVVSLIKSILRSYWTMSDQEQAAVRKLVDQAVADFVQKKSPEE